MYKSKKITDETVKSLIKKFLDTDPDNDLMDVKFDWVFKRIFTADGKQSKLALLAFINSVMEFENDEKIVDVLDINVANAEIPVDNITEKKSVFDIRAKYNSGEQVIIEMQRESTPGFRKRSQHIISKAYASQPITGEDSYRLLKKCYLICVTDFGLTTESGELMKDYRYRDRQGNELTDDVTIIFIELTKVRNTLKKDVSDMTSVEKWAVFIKYASDESKRGIVDQIAETEEGKNGKKHTDRNKQRRGRESAVRKRAFICARQQQQTRIC